MSLSLSEKINLGIDILNTKNFFIKQRLSAAHWGLVSTILLYDDFFCFFNLKFWKKTQASIHKPMVAIDGVGIITIVRLFVYVTRALMHMGTSHATKVDVGDYSQNQFFLSTVGLRIRTQLFYPLRHLIELALPNFIVWN